MTGFAVTSLNSYLRGLFLGSICCRYNINDQLVRVLTSPPVKLSNLGRGNPRGTSYVFETDYSEHHCIEA